MPTEPLIHWPQPILEFIDFVGMFLAIGAVGFRFVVVAGAPRHGATAADSGALAAASRRAAVLGLLGALAGVWHLIEVLPQQAIRAKTTAAALLMHSPPTLVWALLAVAAVVGFVLALRGSVAGWALAGIGVVAGTLRALLFWRWPQAVKSFHVLAGGLWIGTLFMLVVAGLAFALASRTPAERRGPLARSLVFAFSPLALWAVPVLAFAGVNMSFRELQAFRELWTTPYGLALTAKLALVGVVVLLGAFNWKRQKPRLGSEPGGRALVRSATGELLVALLVIVATAVLVSLPSPH